MNPIESTFGKLLGQICWGVEFDNQYLNLRLSFGQPHLNIREPDYIKFRSPRLTEIHSERLVAVKGAWWLWVWCAYWAISREGAKLATYSSPSRKIRPALGMLSGQRLSRVSINAETGATRFEFDLGGRLDVRRFERSSDLELWLLYKPNGYVLSVLANGRYIHGPGSRADKPSRMLGKGVIVVPRVRVRGQPTA